MAICHQSLFKLFTTIPSSSSLSKPKPLLRSNLSLPSRCSLTSTEPKPVYTSVEAFAPATVANLGPGFDFLGCAVDDLGDSVSLTLDPQFSPGEISGDHNSKKLSKNLLWNCAEIAAIEVMNMLEDASERQNLAKITSPLRRLAIITLPSSTLLDSPSLLSILLRLLGVMQPNPNSHQSSITFSSSVAPSTNLECHIHLHPFVR